MSSKRLIEVDLPIGVISQHSVHEQNVRKGHLHSVHVWWATRPLSACRAVILASLLSDPADEHCGEDVRQLTRSKIDWLMSGNLDDPMILRKALLDFIGNVSDWDKSNDERFLNTAREILRVHNPEGALVADPFAGIGSIPFETLRLGLDAFASDLNPVSVLLLQTVLGDLPKYGKDLSQAVRHWGDWVEQRARKKLEQFYPPEKGGGLPLAYLWARTVRCEGPGCGARLPLVGLLWLSQKGKQKAALRYWGDRKNKTVLFEIFSPKSETQVQSSIANRFTATCPVCPQNYTTSYASVVQQLKAKQGGTRDAQLIAVIVVQPDGKRTFRLATEMDLKVVEAARLALKKDQQSATEIGLSLLPDEPTPNSRGPGASRAFSLRRYGMDTWGHAFTERQGLTLSVFAKAVREAHEQMLSQIADKDLARTITTCLALAVSGGLAPYQSSLSFYSSDHMRSIFMQGMAIPMRPDFAEANPLIPELVGGFDYALDQIANSLEVGSTPGLRIGTVVRASATNIPLPNESVHAVITDPPYYDAVPYAGLSDFHYVWLKRMIGELYQDLFQWKLTPKSDEVILDPGPPDPGEPEKDRKFFEDTMRKALSECKRILRQDGIGVVLFAHKGTAGWEALLKALVDAGWTVTASWPIATERGARMRAKDSAVLASTVFLVCRPRPSDAPVGEWRDVLSELQPRVHSWMERLVKEGIVGADAIFACLGPAVEIYSRYRSVETPAGKCIGLSDESDKGGKIIERGYLSYVWEALAKEALSMIFEGADPTGFDQDSRLTAFWLWTIRTRIDATRPKKEANKEKSKPKGYPLEYDAARKIAQGLGIHLEELGKTGGIVEVRGNVATLLFAKERQRYLTEELTTQVDSQGQMTLLGKPLQEEEIAGKITKIGNTTLDKLHQSMLLFSNGKNEALKRFLLEAGRDEKFWRLANAMVSLYPNGSDEKRWVEALLAKKRSLGL